jgi:hypothetical protein
MEGDGDEYGLPSSSGRGQLTKQQLGQNAGEPPRGHRLAAGSTCCCTAGSTSLGD